MNISGKSPPRWLISWEIHHLDEKKMNLWEIPDFGLEFPKTISPHRREIFENCPRALRALGQFSKFPDLPRAIFWGEFPMVSVISYKFWPISHNQIGKNHIIFDQFSLNYHSTELHIVSVISYKALWCIYYLIHWILFNIFNGWVKTRSASPLKIDQVWSPVTAVFWSHESIFLKSWKY